MWIIGYIVAIDKTSLKYYYIYGTLQFGLTGKIIMKTIISVVIVFALLIIPASAAPHDGSVQDTIDRSNADMKAQGSPIDPAVILGGIGLAVVTKSAHRLRKEL